jgi:hypothetical protein
MDHVAEHNISSFDVLQKSMADIKQRDKWLNIGGQLLPEIVLNYLKQHVKTGKINSWDDVHEFYTANGAEYKKLKQQHALASLFEIAGIDAKHFTAQNLNSLLNTSASVKEWMAKGIYEARAKDYQSKFRKLVYDTNEEMNKVIGRLEDNSFIKQTNIELKEYREKIDAFKKNFIK